VYRPGRWGKPEDFAGVAIFLASRASDFIIGEGIAAMVVFSSLVDIARRGVWRLFCALVTKLEQA
jgi:NAD(P)-dependent dehydrogenase (short-subunit alcohol dehydrogenase family)